MLPLFAQIENHNFRPLKTYLENFKCRSNYDCKGSIRYITRSIPMTIWGTRLCIEKVKTQRLCGPSRHWNAKTNAKFHRKLVKNCTYFLFFETKIKFLQKEVRSSHPLSLTAHKSCFDSNQANETFLTTGEDWKSQYCIKIPFVDNCNHKQSRFWKF